MTTLLLARNRVRQIQPNLADSLPNLHTLVLTNNNVAELADLDPLRRFVKLTHLSLLENPVARKEVSRSLFLKEGRLADDVSVALSILDYLADTIHPLPRLSESEGH